MSEILNYVLWPVLFALNLSSFSTNEDRLVWRMILNASSFILATLNMLIRRKPTTMKSNNKRTPPTSQISRRLPVRQKTAVPDISHWLDSDEDTSPIILPDPIRENTPKRELTPFTEISGRLDSLSLNFGKDEECPLTLTYRPPKSQAPTMLSGKAITPSPQRIQSPFSSLKFHSITRQGSLTQPKWPSPAFSKTSLFSGSNSDSLTSGYNLRYRIPQSTVSSNYSNFSRELKSPALRSVFASTSSTLSSNRPKKSKFRSGLFWLSFVVVSALFVRWLFCLNDTVID